MGLRSKVVSHAPDDKGAYMSCIVGRWLRRRSWRS